MADKIVLSVHYGNVEVETIQGDISSGYVFHRHGNIDLNPIMTEIVTGFHRSLAICVGLEGSDFVVVFCR